MLEILPIEKLTPAPENPRRDVGDVTELAASIAAVGILEPLVVTQDNGAYLVVAGARRFAAAKVAGLQEVPCIVRDLDERARAEVMLVENLQREDLAPLEEASAYHHLMELGHSQHQLAERIGRSQSHISKRLALLELPAKARKAVDSGGIALGDALELTKLLPHPERLARAVERGTQAYYGGIASAVDVELREQRQEQKFTELVEKAKGGKVPYREAGSPKSERPHTALPAGSLRVKGWYRALDLPEAQAKAHVKEPCHAVTVLHDYNDPELVPICIEPKRHPKAKRGPTAADRRHEEEQKARAAATKVRREFVRDVLGRSVGDRGSMLERVFPTFLRASHQSVLKLACELLDLEPVRKKTPDGEHLDYTASLKDHAAGRGNLGRVALAVAYATAEESLGSYWASPGIVSYLGDLKAAGYKLAKSEQAMLERARKERD